MILTNIKTGDVGLIRSTFDIKKMDTWLSDIIRFGINFWRMLRRQEKCPANHAGIFIVKNGKITFYEATSKGWVKVDAVEKFAKKDKNDVWIKRSNTPVDEVICETLCEKLLGVRYNFEGIALQSCRQLFDERIMLESKSIEKINKKVYCSQGAGAIVYLSTNEVVCQYWAAADPEDIFFDPEFSLIPQ